MSETLQTAAVTGTDSDADLLAQTAIAVRAAGSALRERFGEVVRYETREQLMRALAGNDDVALDILRPRLTRLRPPFAPECRHTLCASREEWLGEHARCASWAHSGRRG